MWYNSKTINGGRKGKLYTTYEKSFIYLSKAVSIAPTWKSYLGMGLIYSVFSPLNFAWFRGIEHNWEMAVDSDRYKAIFFFSKSIESVPNWQAYYAYVTQFNSDLVRQEREQVLDFF
mgnify:CR=1 FL=1